MDDIFLPDEEDEEAAFERTPVQHIEPEAPNGIQASTHVKLTFGRFVTLVANHSFEEVVERNQNEEVILSTNLLTDLANSRRVNPNPKPYLMLLAGALGGIFLSYFLFNGV